MKYSFMTFSTPELSLTQVLDVARRFGYNGVEIRLDADHKHGIEVNTTAADRQAINDQVAGGGVPLACLATSLRYADPLNGEETLRQTHERIDLAGDLGAPALRVFGGSIPDHLTREQAIDTVADALAAVAGHAAERGVTLCLETHDDWCDPEHVAAVVSRVDHSAVGVNWDIMHPVRIGGASIDSSFAALQPFVRHLHVHDGTLGDFRLTPIGEGAIDHRRALELLLSAGYAGFISGEWIDWEPYETHLPRELATLKGYEAELAASQPER